MLKSKEIIGHITLFSISSYVLGFLIWNIHLNRFGFSEFKIIQTKFIFTGAIAILFVSLIAFIIFTISKNLFKFCTINYYKTFISLFFLFIIYIFLIFPFFIPSWLGGGIPQTLSIIGSEDEINELLKITIPKGEGSQVQTGTLCLAYENEDIFIVLLDDRILQLKKENIRGFGALSGEDRKKIRKTCKWISVIWLFPKDWWNFEFILNYICGLEGFNCDEMNNCF